MCNYNVDFLCDSDQVLIGIFNKGLQVTYLHLNILFFSQSDV